MFSHSMSKNIRRLSFIYETRYCPKFLYPLSPFITTPALATQQQETNMICEMGIWNHQKDSWVKHSVFWTYFARAKNESGKVSNLHLSFKISGYLKKFHISCGSSLNSLQITNYRSKTKLVICLPK